VPLIWVSLFPLEHRFVSCQEGEAAYLTIFLDSCILIYRNTSIPSFVQGEPVLPSSSTLHPLYISHDDVVESKMDLHGLPTLKISLEFGDDEFSFNRFPGDHPGSICGTTYASSSSSPSSSSFGPQTPTSGRSTTPFSTSFDFASSFTSSADTASFDFSPPSSAPSAYFPMTPEAGNVSGPVYPIFPFTPSRGPLDFSGHPLGGCGSQLAPSQTMDMDCSFFVSHLGANPLPSTPSGLAQFGQLSDTAPHWPYPDSPISFDQQSPMRLNGTAQSIKQEHEDDMEAQFTPSNAVMRRALIEEARHRTTMLHQQVQRCSPSPVRARIKREKKPLPMIRGDSRLPLGKVERTGAFKCPMEGCQQRPYRRSEHLKRHVQT
jgi:hypothetical protein